MRVVFSNIWLDGAVQVLQATADACEQNIPFTYLYRYA